MKVIILRGISGSGKTTYSMDILSLKEEHELIAICSADLHFMNKKDEYDFNPAKLPQAHKECFQAFVDTINENTVDTVIVDNTNTQLHEIAPYLRYAELHDCDVEIVRLECLAEEGTSRNIHDVPERTINAMLNRMEKLPSYWPKERVINTSE